MTTTEKVALEIARLDEILRQRGQFYEDEQATRAAFGLVALWLEEDRIEEERIEVEAAAAAELEEQERIKNDPNYKTQQLFGTYRNKLKREGRMR